MRELSLFTGAGGGLLATKHLLGWTTIGYVEIEPYCQAVLVQRIADGYLDPAPIFGDIREFISEGYAESYQGMVDVITAGFPCQPFSVAGKQRAQADNKNLWPETLLSIQIIRPQWIFLENVPGILASSHGYFGTILQGLAQSGYSGPWDCISAAAIGANHLRNRFWFVANSSCEQTHFKCSRSIEFSRQQRQSLETWEETSRQEDRKTNNNHSSRLCEIPNSNSKGLQAFGQQTRIREEERETRSSIKRGNLLGETGDTTWWDIEPRLGRVAHGVAHRVDRLKAIGNGQVSRVVEVAWKVLSGEKWQ